MPSAAASTGRTHIGSITSNPDVSVPTERKLENRVAIVTGGGSGIGEAIAFRFTHEGAHVAVLDVDPAAAERVVATITDAGGSAAAYPCDVGRQTDVLQAFRDVQERFGALDILINNAGVTHVGTVEQTTEEDFDRVYAINVRGVYNCLKGAVAAMKARGGSIVNMASITSHVGIPERFAYSMSKGAVLTMTYSVACDYVHQGIRCNAISPARVHTPLVDGFLARNYQGREQEMFDKLSAVQPIGRMGRPDEVASLALFLCSDEAAYITGNAFPLDGGFVNLRER
jgi:2-keto-3-deoxy-L-fuconate dehydrogenase